MQQQGKQQDAPQAALERGFDRLALWFVRGGEQAAAFLLHGGQPQAEMVQGEGGRQQEHNQLAANQPEKQVAGRKQHFPAVALRCNSVAEHHCGQEHARIQKRAVGSHRSAFLLQALDHRPHRFGGIEVRGHDLDRGDGDVEFFLQLGHQREDGQRVQIATVNQVTAGRVIHAGLQAL